MCDVKVQNYAFFLKQPFNLQYNFITTPKKIRANRWAIEGNTDLHGFFGFVCGALEAYTVVCGGADAFFVAVGDDVGEAEVAVVDDGVHLLLAAHILDLSAAEVVGFRQLQRLGIGEFGYHRLPDTALCLC